MTHWNEPSSFSSSSGASLTSFSSTFLSSVEQVKLLVVFNKNAMIKDEKIARVIGKADKRTLVCQMRVTLKDIERVCV